MLVFVGAYYILKNVLRETQIHIQLLAFHCYNLEAHIAE